MPTGSKQSTRFGWTSATSTQESIDHARKIVDAFAAQPEAGVLSIDGQMIDAPHHMQALRILARAEIKVPD